MDRYAEHAYARYFFYAAIIMIAAAILFKSFAQESPKADKKAQEEKPIVLKPEDRDFLSYLKKADENATADQLRQENEQLREQLVQVKKQLIQVARDARLWKLRAENNCLDCELDESGTFLRKPKK